MKVMKPYLTLAEMYIPVPFNGSHYVLSANSQKGSAYKLGCDNLSIQQINYTSSQLCRDQAGGIIITNHTALLGSFLGPINLYLCFAPGLKDKTERCTVTSFIWGEKECPFIREWVFNQLQWMSSKQAQLCNKIRLCRHLLHERWAWPRLQSSRWAFGPSRLFSII